MRHNVSWLLAEGARIALPQRDSRHAKRLLQHGNSSRAKVSASSRDRLSNRGAATSKLAHNCGETATERPCPQLKEKRTAYLTCPGQPIRSLQCLGSRAQSNPRTQRQRIQSRPKAEPRSALHNRREPNSGI